MKRHVFRLCTLILLMLSVSACASVEPSGYLRSNLPLRKGKHVDFVHLSPSFRVTDYSALVITIETPLTTLQNDLSPKQLNKYLEWELINQLEKTHVFSQVTASTDEIKPGTKAVQCILAITELDPGSRALRWWFGEFGAGHTVIQVEGRVIDHQTQQEFMQLIENRRGAAIFDITGGNSQALIEEDLRAIAESVVKEIVFPVSD